MYRQQLLDGGISEEELAAIENKFKVENEEAYARSKEHEFKVEEWGSEHWDKIKDPQTYGKFKDTGVDVNHLRKIGQRISELPANRTFHEAIKKIFKARMDAITSG